ncbi:MAG: AAA family ATPase [Saprospiraceae bacterium]|nr:AAA family ATPase [Saprospiraceae bacterium]
MTQHIAWNWRCVGIKGSRGVGKTTMLLQQMKASDIGDQSIYLSLDDLHFKHFTLRETVEAFRRDGVTHFYLDEVHKYTGWSMEIKNLFDLYVDIHLVFTGSSLVELHRQEADLSRRAVMYDLPGLSFREYLAFSDHLAFPSYDLDFLLAHHRDIALEISSQIKPIAHFKQYLIDGYYPFFLEDRPLTPVWLRQVVNLILNLDISNAEGMPTLQTQKIARLLQFISSSAPFKPNFANLSRTLGLDRDTIARYLNHLEKAQLISMIYAQASGLSGVQRPEKVYLDNSNLMYALSGLRVEEGAVRETFFQNQLRAQHSLTYPAQGDFLVNERYVFEVGGKGKTKRQIASLPDSFLVLDDIESGSEGVIPLWLMGFLY